MTNTSETHNYCLYHYEKGLDNVNVKVTYFLFKDQKYEH